MRGGEEIRDNFGTALTRVSSLSNVCLSTHDGMPTSGGKTAVSFDFSF